MKQVNNNSTPRLQSPWRTGGRSKRRVPSRAALHFEAYVSPSGASARKKTTSNSYGAFQGQCHSVFELHRSKQPLTSDYARLHCHSLGLPFLRYAFDPLSNPSRNLG